ncbi:hypothetical protein CLHUN_02040 [Ruminiclostridium hungatei]|uniref:Uncharacterized protein n=1 Tax=Ruminiclostridium hungatei TaxID=48256 RepID=A0A1V4SR66_RUMHU|nr:hypothetical protein [Ruminiclostridium hungatei]OPX46388.1 hypothetical protein CLHUN_02040 [Ruminiclostridium hungatei]
MAKTYTDQVYSGTLTASEVTIATISANTTFVMRGFWISNSNAADKKATLKIDDKRFVAARPVPTLDTLLQDNLNIPVTAGKTIKATGEVATDMDYYIWGVNEVIT